ncbi:hypothetical protein E3P92_00674 [Wallemia ichthyophaga]|uniref:Prefoldin subunit 2 n=2 Tax=Wallemia ichthyophaga TaxID=245174 RepID=A0A4T0L4F6_WALIC|nr:putative prefoldin subunit 2 [Wallemia ichthyophaga EXF-994]TIA75870.1 hypothetical protein E3P91_00179 [Wallemia ichthyophaga]EOQ98889.1 putative prefoldin subunit 2 [Wallemia ichthyophaga EXF-994]TIA79724.1 hypothetical protein E3P98_03125 [Wallemia ichthyophaga]TIA93248.1 hypothetical protein E3P97_01062 [Wallemia ichthyophaga]TIA98043.1 hypothetical protein E3P95_02612 [Wallemia ichthyophaga]
MASSSQQSSKSNQEISIEFNTRRNELQSVAQKIGELEQDAEEHVLVTQTLEEARKVDPARKCFRMIGGTLAERTVDEVLPALNTNLTGIKQALSQLIQAYKTKENQFINFQREFNIKG